MRRCLTLLFLLALLVGCGGEVKTTTEMVYVPEGRFLMGSTDLEISAIVAECAVCEADWFRPEQPQHTVTLDAFWIDKTEVTNSQYRQCVRDGACKKPRCLDRTARDFDGSDQPVVCVSWHQAQTYCEWVGKRLPTEAEWEKAARGTDGRKHPWGNTDPDCAKANYAPCRGATMGATLQVGSHPSGASPYGALDMGDNASEWVADWYDADYYSESPSRNPDGPSSGEERVVRGGSWVHSDWELRSAARDGLDPDYWSSLVVSFRCVISDPSSP